MPGPCRRRDPATGLNWIESASDGHGVHRVGYLLYLAAGVEFARGGQPMAALVAIGLLGWAIAVELLASSADWAGPRVDESGFGTALPRHDIVFLSTLDRLSHLARFMAVGLGLFGPLLFLWALLL